MKSLLLVVLSFVCLDAVNSWKGPTYMDYNFGITFSRNSPEQTGTITELNIEKGLLSSKTMNTAGFLGQKGVIPSGDYIIGYVRVPNTFKDWKKMTFVWNGSEGATIEVDSILFRPDLDVDSHLLKEWSKHFCHDGPIKSGEKVTFKLC